MRPNRTRAAQYEALKAVNKELVGLYWDLGKMIVQKQVAAGWGKAVVENLALDLQKEFPGERGYSATNLWYMVQLYTEYQGDTFLQPMIREIGWTHNLLIMKKMQSCPRKVVLYSGNRQPLISQSGNNSWNIVARSFFTISKSVKSAGGSW